MALCFKENFPMIESDIRKLKNSIDSLVYASTKAEAKPIYNKLNFEASQLSEEIDPYALGKLKEAISHAMSASGQVRDKAHWESCMKRSWYVFESNVNHKDNT